MPPDRKLIADGLFFRFLFDLVKKRFLPLVDVLSWWRLRSLVLQSPGDVIYEEFFTGQKSKGPVSYAIKGVAYQTTIVATLCLGLTYLLDIDMDSFDAWKQQTTRFSSFTIPLQVFLGSYAFRFFLAGQPGSANPYPLPTPIRFSHVVHMTYAVSRFFLPVVALSCAMFLLRTGYDDDAVVFLLYLPSMVWMFMVILSTIAGLRQILRCNLSEIAIAWVGASVVVLAVFWGLGYIAGTYLQASY